jgi:hypothetical protein
MSDQNPEAVPLEPASFTPSYHDRSTGLIIFGVMTVLLGGLSALLVLLMLGVSAMPGAAAQGQNGLIAVLPAIAMYGGLAVALIWLGIGSIMARRWARALLLIFSWSWLVMSILGLGAMAFLMPKIFANLPSATTPGHPGMPPVALGPFLIIIFLIDGFLLIVLPAIWTFFYNSRHVKATCEARDPVPRWTDACPLPVLALCLWLLFSVVMLLVMPLAGHGVMPFFGMFLTGAVGTLFYLVLAVLWLGAAWLLYRLDVRGWWLILIAMALFMISSIVTYIHHDLLEMYQLMGYPQAQIDQIQRTGLLEGNYLTWLTALFALPMFAYLLFIKRYFPAKS